MVILPLPVAGQLAPGLALQTTLTSAKPIGVWAAPDALVARVIVKGQGVLLINLHPGGAPADSTPPSPKPAAPKPPAKP